jgi:hypothetical protein
MSTDSLELRYGIKLYPDAEELSVAVYEDIKTRKFDSLLSYLVTTAVLKDEFDTLDLAYLNRLADVKSRYVEANLRKQHRKLLKEAKALHINLRTMELVDKVLRFKSTEGRDYVEVIYYCKSGKQKFYLSFVCLKIMNHWFVSDELSIRLK